MQFYLIAPVIFILAGRGRRRRMLVFGGVALALAVVGLIYPMRGSQYLAIKYHFEVAAWPMAFGVLCEFAKSMVPRHPARRGQVYLRIRGRRLYGVIIIMLFGMEAKKLVIAAGGMLLFPCLFSYLFGLTVPGVIGRWLAWCGARTYSIYLCQQPFTLCGYLPAIFQPLGAAVSIIVGAWWFRIFELPVPESEQGVPFSCGGAAGDIYGYRDKLTPMHCEKCRRVCAVSTRKHISQ